MNVEAEVTHETRKKSVVLTKMIYWSAEAATSLATFRSSGKISPKVQAAAEHVPSPK
jgi:hypothetical protein